MKKRLVSMLHAYLLEHHTDLLIALQEDHRLDHYLTTKVDSVSDLILQLADDNRPDYVIEALCLEELASDLRPSRFGYIRDLLEDEFPEDHRKMLENGILTYEVINLIGACEPIFEVFALSGEDDDSPQLRNAVTGMIAEYLDR